MKTPLPIIFIMLWSQYAWADYNIVAKAHPVQERNMECVNGVCKIVTETVLVTTPNDWKDTSDAQQEKLDQLIDQQTALQVHQQQLRDQKHSDDTDDAKYTNLPYSGDTQ